MTDLLFSLEVDFYLFDFILHRFTSYQKNIYLIFIYSQLHLIGGFGLFFDGNCRGADDFVIICFFPPRGHHILSLRVCVVTAILHTLLYYFLPSLVLSCFFFLSHLYARCIVTPFLFLFLVFFPKRTHHACCNVMHAYLIPSAFGFGEFPFRFFFLRGVF